MLSAMLRLVVPCVLIAYWTVVVASVEEQPLHGDVVKPADSNSGVQDVTNLSKLTTVRTT